MAETTVAATDWLVGSGEVVDLIRATDWARTPLGPRSDWPWSLKAAMNIVVANRFPMALLWGAELLLLYNDAYRVICGNKHPHSLGRSTRDVWPEVWHVNEPIFRAVMERGETLYFEDKCFSVERRGHREEAHFTLCYSPVRENGAIAGTLVVLQETTAVLQERNRIQAKLTETAERFQQILDCAPVAVYVKDADGRYLLGNRRLERFTGRPVEATLGTTDYDWFRAADADRWRENDLQVLRSGQVSEFEESGVDAEGRAYVNLSVKFPLTDGAGRPVAVCGISTDITDRKEADAALRRANEQLAAADRQKDEFLAVLSHELRNPLAPIRYALPRLRQERLSEGGERAVAVIDRQLAHLTRMVDDLLDVARITTGKFDLRREHVALATVIRTAAEEAAPAIAAGEHSLDLVVPDAPIWVLGDAARLAQIVTNLLDNGAKFTPRRGRIVVAAMCEEGQAVIRVRDNGSGIAPAEQATIFEMFRHADRGNAVVTGLGIGLALVKRLVEMHGGTIAVESAGIGQGTEFTVRLPLAAGDPVVAATTAPTPAGRQFKVLVVDDNPDLVEMLAVFVGLLGHDVRKALDGPSALSAAVNYRPDVVLLDLGLPGLSGLEVARELRRLPETADARLVALTGLGQSKDKLATQAAGFDFHLTKPADPDTLERLFREFEGEHEPDV